jgi:hypothetical protein
VHGYVVGSKRCTPQARSCVTGVCSSGLLLLWLVSRFNLSARPIDPFNSWRYDDDVHMKFNGPIRCPNSADAAKKSSLSLGGKNGNVLATEAERPFFRGGARSRRLADTICAVQCVGPATAVATSSFAPVFIGWLEFATRISLGMKSRVSTVVAQPTAKIDRQPLSLSCRRCCAVTRCPPNHQPTVPSAPPRQETQPDMASASRKPTRRCVPGAHSVTCHT